MRVTAVVVNHNGARHLPACLAALRRQDHDELRIVVVDNASTDGSDRVLEAERRRPGRHPVEVRRSATNRGFAGAVNDVLAADAADAVLTCNPDAVAAPDHVRRLAAVLAGRPAVGAVQGKLLRPAGRTAGRIDTTGHLAFRNRLFRNRGEGEPDDGRLDRPGPVFGVSGALALYRRAMLDDVALDLGGRREWFDEDLFAYFEDVDLDWRAALRGWDAWYEPAAVGWHERGGARARRTVTVETLNWRNRLLVLVKCDAAGSLAAAAPGVVLTTGLKTAELALTSPPALARAVAGLIRLTPRMLAKRRLVHGRAAVPSAEVVRRWFGGFDHRRWVRTWWERVTAGRGG